MTQNVLIFTHHKNHFDHWLKSFASYLSRQGHKVIHRSGTVSNFWFEYVIPRCHHVFIWNGNEDHYLLVKDLCRRYHVPLSIMEVGYFPQKDHVIFDRKGINARSELMEDSLAWVGENHIDRAYKLSEAYLGSRKYSGKDLYILVPLQLEQDTNIKNHSPYKSMQKFIDHTEEKFPDEKIIFKKHPLDKSTYTVENPNNTIVTSGDILTIAQDAKLVYGINSTSLLETLLMQVPTIAIGEGFLKKHQDNTEKLIAALWDKQAHINEKDYQYWLHRYTDFFKAQENCKQKGMHIYQIIKALDMMVLSINNIASYVSTFSLRVKASIRKRMYSIYPK